MSLKLNKQEEIMVRAAMKNCQCISCKMVLRRLYPNAFKDKQKYCCDTLKRVVEDCSYVFRVDTAISGPVWALSREGGWKITYCPLCGKLLPPPII